MPPPSVIRIGLFGESPHDTAAIKVLLERRYGGQIDCFPLLRGIRGSLLDDAQILRGLRIEYQSEKPQIVIAIRDLDALEDDRGKVVERQQWFRRVNRVVARRGVFLLSIYSLEALILADIDVFNRHYGCVYVLPGPPATVVKPEVELKKATAQTKEKYLEGEPPKLFRK